MALMAQVLYKDFYSFTDSESGERVQGGRVQIYDQSAAVKANGKVGSPAFFLKAEFSVSAQIPDDKIPGRYELTTVRVPRKDKEGRETMEERITGAKLLQ
jgi:hypothetical protein